MFSTSGARMQDVESLLVDLGLSVNEAKIYLSALTLGESTAMLIALESQVKRTTVYGCLDSLLDKGLLHITIKGKRKLFVAEDPNYLLILLEKKKQKLNSALPLLRKEFFKAPDNFHQIKQYQGLESIKLLYDNFLSELAAGDEYLVISHQSKWLQLDVEYFSAFIAKRKKLNLDVKLLLQTEKHAERCQQDVSSNQQVKLLPGHVNLNINAIILPNKIIYMQLAEPVLAVVMENPHVVSMHREMFYLLWKVLA